MGRSVERMKSKITCLFGGNRENPKKENTSSCSDAGISVDQDLIKYFQEEQNSFQKIMQTPLNISSVEETSNEVSTKKRSRSIVAMLMGLDGPPSPPPIESQRRRFSDSSLKRTCSLGGQRNEKLFSPESDMSNTIAQQQFKDVRKDTEASHVTNQSCLLQASAKGKVARKELANVQEKRKKVVSECNSFKSIAMRKIDSQVKAGSGYVGNVNLHNMPRSKSAIESDVKTLPSRNLCLLGDRLPSLSTISDSSVNQKAKKRISGRSKMRHGIKETGMIGKGSMQGEMLSFSDTEMRSEKLNAVNSPVGVSGEFTSHTGCVMPSGINSKDGWKDADIRNTPRSRTLPPSIRHEYSRMSDDLEAHVDKKEMVLCKPFNQARIKGVRRNFNHREDLLSKDLRCNGRYRSSHHKYDCNTQSTGSLPDGYPNHKATETYFENEAPTEQMPLISQIHDGDTIKMSYEFSNKLARDLDSSAVEKDSLNPQEPYTAKPKGSVSRRLFGPELESSEISKEVYHLKPFLDVSPTEDASSHSDCYESVDCQIRELTNKFKPLKMERSICEGLKLKPCDVDIEEGSSDTGGSDSLESVYVEDFLHHSGFYDTNQCTSMNTSPFDYLQEKYPEETTSDKSEMRLYHDLVCDAIRLSEQMASCSWISPGRRGVQMALQKLGFEDQLHKLLAKQQKEVEQEPFDNIHLDQDPGWSEPLKEFDIVGKQIAELLLKDLVIEVLTM